MSLATPPIIASWLLERFTPGEMHEALAGDLEEEFHHGRGKPWYWRQVLSAVFIRQVDRARFHWTAFLFAAVWSAISPSLFLLEIHLIENERLMERFRQLQSPWFTVSKGVLEISIFFLTLWLGLILYGILGAWASRGFDIRRFVRALLLTVPLFLEIWMAVAVATVLINMAFPQRIFNLDQTHASLLQMVISAALSPATVVTFCTMVPSLYLSFPRKPSRSRSL